MNTSQYDPATRKAIKRQTRNPQMKLILDAGRAERAHLEQMLRERSLDIKSLKDYLQRFADAGGWYVGMETFGIKKKPEEKPEDGE